MPDGTDTGPRSAAGCGPKSVVHGVVSAYVSVMAHSKDKGSRETKKPKKAAKPKAAAPAPVIPVSPHAHDAQHK